MKVIISLLAALVITEQANIYHQHRVYNILVVLKNNVSVLHEARGLIGRHYITTRYGNWSVKFIEFGDISSVPWNLMRTLLNNFTSNINTTWDGVIFNEISKTTAFVSQTFKAVAPSIGLHETGSAVLPVRIITLLYYYINIDPLHIEY